MTRGRNPYRRQARPLPPPIMRRRFVDLQGEETVLVTPPPSLDEQAMSMIEPERPLTDDEADAVVIAIRLSGGKIWLRQQEDGTVRVRAMLPVQPDEEMSRWFGRAARMLAKAVARSGDFQPPADNPYGDQPFEPGGTWDWGEDS